MIFNEIYSAYYNAVARILVRLTEGCRDEKELEQIVQKYAFGESMLTVLPALKSEKWQLMHKDLTTPLKHPPTLPLTMIQKQWLKAVLTDPRVRLFDLQIDGLEDVEPLFTSDDYRIYDQYSDGDPYEDEKYITHFRTILTAMKTGQNIKIEMVNRKGNVVYSRCVPKRLEYSEKDDKFRLITAGCRFVRTVNLARLTKCKLYDGEAAIEADAPETRYDSITLKVSEERNTLERCMLHFAHFEKRAEKNDGHYLLHVKFHRDDEPELVIRVLSFGPMVEVLDSPRFRELIIKKLKDQKSCEL